MNFLTPPPPPPPQPPPPPHLIKNGVFYPRKPLNLTKSTRLSRRLKRWGDRKIVPRRETLFPPHSLPHPANIVFPKPKRASTDDALFGSPGCSEQFSRSKSSLHFSWHFHEKSFLNFLTPPLPPPPHAPSTAFEQKRRFLPRKPLNLTKSTPLSRRLKRQGHKNLPLARRYSRRFSESSSKSAFLQDLIVRAFMRHYLAVLIAPNQVEWRSKFHSKHLWDTFLAFS